MKIKTQGTAGLNSAVPHFFKEFEGTFELWEGTILHTFAYIVFILSKILILVLEKVQKSVLKCIILSEQKLLKIYCKIKIVKTIIGFIYK